MDLNFILPVIVVCLIIYGFYKFFTRNKMEEENNEDKEALKDAEEFEEEEKRECNGCGEEFTEDDLYTCEECDESYCDDCCIQFDNTEGIYCKKCIDKKYPREKEIEYKEKIVEKPVIKYVDKDEKEISGLSFDKSRFD